MTVTFCWDGGLKDGCRQRILSHRELGRYMQLSKIISVLVVATVVAGVIINLPDIKRYIKISSM